MATSASLLPHSRPRLRIGLVGGVHRAEVQFMRAAAAAGYDLELHTGEMAGRRAQSLAAMIHRVHLLVILTDVNSHNAVLAARRLAAEYGTHHVLLRRCNPARLTALVQSMTAAAPPRPPSRLDGGSSSGYGRSAAL